jgi:hypothetical protein
MMVSQKIEQSVYPLCEEDSDEENSISESDRRQRGILRRKLDILFSIRRRQRGYNRRFAQFSGEEDSDEENSISESDRPRGDQIQEDMRSEIEFSSAPYCGV